jgi:hypothetical protein
VFRLFGKITVTVPLTDFANGRMVRSWPLAIRPEAAWIRDLQLLGNMPHNDSRNVYRVR